MRLPDILDRSDWRPNRQVPWGMLIVMAVAAILLWQLAEAIAGRFTHSAYLHMLRAAHTMQAATQVARAQRMELGLMQSSEFDPNETGLIGSEFTEQTTTLGDPAAKRTATNPDLAAALVRHIADLDLPEAAPVLIVVSGSFIGADLAAIIAVEELGLQPILVASLAASMHGATDAKLTWLDIEAELRRKGVIAARSQVALYGGGSGIGGSMSDVGKAVLETAAERHRVPMLMDDDLEQLMQRLTELTDSLAGGVPALFINAGGSVAALGSCIDVALIPPLTDGSTLGCKDGVPGMMVRTAVRGIPVINLLNIRRLAAEWSLPYDPIPMPVIGNNRAVFGMPLDKATEKERK